jgi:hypothetical protein
MTIANPEIHQLASCKGHICYRKYFSDPDNIRKAHEAILAGPPGEFRISDFIKRV